MIVNGYATGEEFVEHLTDDRVVPDDSVVERAIESASRVIDAWTHRRFYTDETASSRLFSGGAGVLYVDDFTELVSVTPEASFGVLGAAYDSSSYRPGPLNAAISGEPYHWIEGTTWWAPVVSVEAVWGWPSVPKAVTQACLLLAARIYKRRESVNATLGFDDFALRLSSTDPDVAMLLDPYRWLTVG